MNETPLFFSNDNQRLFGILHNAGAAQKKYGWVFCHPFAEEKLWAHRVYVSMARELAKKSYPVLRFDYRGYGDSEGRFEDYTIDDQLADIDCAISTLMEKAPGLQSVGLIGLRYGATLAALAAERNRFVSRLVLWDPIADMDRYMQEVLRANLTTQMVMHGKVVTNRDELTQNIMDGQSVNVDGYDLTRKLFQAASGINLLNGQKNFSGPCQIVQIGRANQPVRKDIQALADLYPHGHVIQVVEQPFWKEIKNFVQRSEGLSTNLFGWLESAGDE
jgi:exosortase A-associated hydrolase 2